MKPTSKQIEGAVAELGAIPFFPSDAVAQLVVARHMAKFVGGVAELRWLVDAAVNAMPEWKGIPELRGLYCTRHKPADGIEANCSLAGYTADDCEMADAYAINAPQRADTRLLAGDVAEVLAVEPAALQAALKALPLPNAADKRASRKLLGHLVQ